MTEAEVHDAQFYGALRYDPTGLERLRSETARLGWSFLGRSPRELSTMDSIAFFGHLQGKSLEELLGARLLRSGAVRRFLTKGLDLVGTLPPGSVRTTDTVREMRGRVQWQKTALARVASGDPSLLVVSRNSKASDTIETKLVAHAAHAIYRLCRNSALPSTEETAAVASILGHSRLDGTVAGAEVSLLDLRRARRSRHRGFRSTALPAIELLVRAERSPRETLKDFLDDSTWIPDDPAALFELWWLFTLTNVLLNRDWVLQELRTTASRGPAFTLEKNGEQLEFFYQRLPKALSRNTRYQLVQRANGLGVSQRRPDIVVLRTSVEGHRSCVIAEVKLSRSPAYIADGIYKVFGYLYDYASTEEDVPMKGLMLCWSSGGTADLESVLPVLGSAEVPLREGELSEYLQNA